MSQGSDQGKQPEALSTPRQPELNWDVSGAAIYTCDIANSAAGSNDVLLNLGVTQRGGEAPVELSARLVRRLTLVPLTARHLRDMLRNVIADIDADTPPGGR